MILAGATQLLGLDCPDSLGPERGETAGGSEVPPLSEHWEAEAQG